MGKLGRNQPCHCGSGKKYKKCCLDKEEKVPGVSYDKNYFQLKGKNAEGFVHELAKKSFLTDWCYLNPSFPDGKELCDLLVVFGNIAIIWQIKDLKRQDNGKYSRNKVEKNLKQLLGARRRLFELKEKIILKNPRRGEEEFDPQLIKEIYLISALVGEGEDYYEFVKKIKEKTIHIIDRKSTEILLNELDTIKDFVGYLREKERFLSLDIKMDISGGEEELLAYYLINERSFKKLEEGNYVIIQEGIWEDLINKPEFQAKREEDKISYFWDFLIDKAHLSGERDYEIVAREMAKLNRFERRFKSKTFFEGQAKANLDKKNTVYRRTIHEDGITYCFFYAKSPKREARKNRLAEICFATRGYFKENQKVLGIATEMEILQKHSFEFCLVNFPTWGEEEEKIAEEIKERLGIFKNQEMLHATEDEYPLMKD
jgi:hypothetical protein